MPTHLHRTRTCAFRGVRPVYYCVVVRRAAMGPAQLAMALPLAASHAKLGTLPVVHFRDLAA